MVRCGDMEVVVVGCAVVSFGMLVGWLVDLVGRLALIGSFVCLGFGCVVCLLVGLFGCFVWFSDCLVSLVVV